VDLSDVSAKCPHCGGCLGATADPDFVYFLRRERGPIKIGLSKNPGERRYQIMLDVGERVEILAMIVGSRDKERALHKKFGHLKITKEWFRPDPELLDYIGSLPDDVLKTRSSPRGNAHPSTN
jgi:hypothetical protein